MSAIVIFAYTVQLLAVSCFIIVDHEFSKLFYFIKFVVSDLYCYIHIFLVYTNECETSAKNRSLICMPLFSLKLCCKFLLLFQYMY